MCGCVLQRRDPEEEENARQGIVLSQDEFNQLRRERQQIADSHEGASHRPQV